jgi:hypothetical protein
MLVYLPLFFFLYKRRVKNIKYFTLSKTGLLCVTSFHLQVYTENSTEYMHLLLTQTNLGII